MQDLRSKVPSIELFRHIDSMILRLSDCLTVWLSEFTTGRSDDDEYRSQVSTQEDCV
jgi:hypothetical protein